ncbi:MAG: DUF4935 domain-containing protein, partial [Acidobacteria bacterium]|nr:DUF4935 domain-containing protein [Acidobacteriota bacterium]
MTSRIWKRLPYAIYLDTNALRSAGIVLDADWINELLSLTHKLDLKLCISDLVLTEWSEYVSDTLSKNRQKALSSLGLLKQHSVIVPEIGLDGLTIPDSTRLISLLSEKLKGAGFEIVPNWDAPLSKLLDEAIKKKPPFEHGGKGLCDAVILESYAQHAKQSFKDTHVLVVSNDNSVRESAYRFKEKGINVTFVKESDIVKTLKSLLDEEIEAYISAKQEKLKSYVASFEEKILEYARSAPIRITDWMLLGGLGSKEEDRVSGSIERVLSIRPIKISDVFGGVPLYGDKVAGDRYPVRVSIEIELNIIVHQYSSGMESLFQTRAIIQPNNVNESAPVHIERQLDFRSQEIPMIIRRELSILATIDAESEKRDLFND